MRVRNPGFSTSFYGSRLVVVVEAVIEVRRSNYLVHKLLREEHKDLRDKQSAELSDYIDHTRERRGRSELLNAMLR